MYAKEMIQQVQRSILPEIF